jgi:hypothetical protein
MKADRGMGLAAVFTRQSNWLAFSRIAGLTGPACRQTNIKAKDSAAYTLRRGMAGLLC